MCVFGFLPPEIQNGYHVYCWDLFEYTQCDKGLKSFSQDTKKLNPNCILMLIGQYFFCPFYADWRKKLAWKKTQQKMTTIMGPSPTYISMRFSFCLFPKLKTIKKSFGSLLYILLYEVYEIYLSEYYDWLAQ